MQDEEEAEGNVPEAEYVDIQINGYDGVDFNDPETSTDHICSAMQSLAATGTDSAFPTVITAAPEVMLKCIQKICSAKKKLEDFQGGERIRGIHIEGPFLSPEPGYIGAHPAQHAKGVDLQLLERLIDATQGLPTILTLAPEIDQDAVLTNYCSERGVKVAAGHTNASLSDMETCIQHGLSLFTHLGNGCPRLMDRHDNIIYRALHLRDNLHFSLIADGFHVPRRLFQLLLALVDPNRLIVVSDAISAAGLGPGVYKLGDREVCIGEDGAARDASGEHFVGSASSMSDADDWLNRELGLDQPTRRALLRENALRWLNESA